MLDPRHFWRRCERYSLRNCRFRPHREVLSSRSPHPSVTPPEILRECLACEKGDEWNPRHYLQLHQHQMVKIRNTWKRHLHHLTTLKTCFCKTDAYPQRPGATPVLTTSERSSLRGPRYVHPSSWAVLVASRRWRSCNRHNLCCYCSPYCSRGRGLVSWWIVWYCICAEMASFAFVLFFVFFYDDGDIIMHPCMLSLSALLVHAAFRSFLCLLVICEYRRYVVENVFKKWLEFYYREKDNWIHISKNEYAYNMVFLCTKLRKSMCVWVKWKLFCNRRDIKCLCLRTYILWRVHNPLESWTTRPNKTHTKSLDVTWDISSGVNFIMTRNIELCTRHK